MSYTAMLLTLAAVHIAANASPGPNLLLVTRVAAGQSREAGFWTALGLTVGAAIWATVAALGLSLLSYMDWLQHALRILGGAYLFYLAARIWSGAPLTPEGHPTMAGISWRPFRLGLMTNLANPLSLVFFGGIFAALLPPALPAWVRAAAVAVIVVDALLWYVALALMLSVAPIRLAYRRAKRWIDRAMGGILALFGLRLMLSAR